jgi:hypothetical protein
MPLPGDISPQVLLKHIIARYPGVGGVHTWIRFIRTNLHESSHEADLEATRPPLHIFGYAGMSCADDGAKFTSSKQKRIS